MTTSKTTKQMGERSRRKIGNKSRLSDWLWGAGILAVPTALALVFGLLYFSWYTPLTPDQLTEMTGTVKKWELERHRPRQSQTFSSTTTDLLIYTVEHDRYFVVKSNYYDEGNYFDAAGFKQDIKEGDVLTFMVLKEDVQNMLGRIEVHGLASNKRVYLSMESANAYDVENHQMALYLFIGSLVCLAILIPPARLFFITEKKAKKAAKQGLPS